MSKLSLFISILASQFSRIISLLCLFSFYSSDSHTGSVPPPPSCHIFFSTGSLLPGYKRALLPSIPKQNRALLWAPYPLKLLSLFALILRLELSPRCFHLLGSHLLFSSTRHGCDNVTGHSCSFCDVTISTHHSSFSLDFWVAKQTYSNFYAGYFNPICPLTVDTYSELSPGLFSPILSLDNSVCAYGI